VPAHPGSPRGRAPPGTWGYTRFAKRELGAEAVRGLRGALKWGATLNVVGMALTLVSAQQVVGTLIAKSLLAPGVLGSLAGGGPLASPAAAPVTALDIFVVQANTNTMCSHLVGLAAALALLSRSQRWADKPPTK
jgi:hypothetical protein